MNYLYLFLSAMICFSTPTFGDQNISVKISSTHLPGNVVTSVEEGFFIELFLEVFKDSKFTPNIELFPIRRAVSQFVEGPAVMLAGHMEGLHKDQYHEIPIGFHDGMTFFTNLERDPSLVSNKKSWKRIGTIKGWVTPSGMIRNNQEIIEVDSIPQLIKLLQSGRIQGFAGYRYLVVYSLRDQKISNILHNPKLLEDNRNVVFLVKKSPKGHLVAKFFRKKLKEIVKNGSYKKLLDKYGIPNWLLNPHMKTQINKH